MKNKKNIERVKRDVKNLADSTKDAFVDYVNDITDKAQKITAEKLDKLEKKAEKVSNDTKASRKSQTRTLNNMLENISEYKSSVDTILFQ